MVESQIPLSLRDGKKAGELQAHQLGISGPYVSRIEKRALMNLLYHEFYKQKR